MFPEMQPLVWRGLFAALLVVIFLLGVALTALGQRLQTRARRRVAAEREYARQVLDATGLA